MEKKNLSLVLALMSVAAAGAAAPRLDFSVSGSLRVTRGAFQDGATFATLEPTKNLQQGKKK